MERIKNLLAAQTLKRSGITFGGTVVNAILGAIFYILAARVLGPSGFGVLSVALLVMTLTSDVSELGTGTSIVNFVPKYLKEKKEIAYKYLKLTLVTKLLVWLLVGSVGIIFASFISNNLFNKPELSAPLQIAFVGVLSMLLFSFIIQAMQSMQKFWSWSLIQISSNFIRLLFFLVIFYFGIINVESTLIVYILVPILAFFVGLRIIGTDFLFVKNYKSVFSDFLKYNKWVALFTVFAALSARADTFITARLLDTYEVGIYSAANQMVKIIPQIVLALGTVIGPKMAELKSYPEFLTYFKKTQVLVFVLSILGIATIPIVIMLIPYIFGNEYLSSAGVFVVLFIAMIVFLISVPIHTSIFYYFSFPKLFSFMSFFHLILVVILGYFLISAYGAMGAAYTVLIGQIFDFIIPAIFLYSKIKNNS